MKGYLTIKEVANKWNITPRRVQILCAEGLIPGATKFANAWAIPESFLSGEKLSSFLICCTFVMRRMLN